MPAEPPQTTPASAKRPMSTSQWATALTVIAIAAYAVTYGLSAAYGPFEGEGSLAQKATTGLSFAGFGVALLGFALAVRARIKKESWRGLWLALAFFPILVIVVVFTDGLIFQY